MTTRGNARAALEKLVGPLTLAGALEATRQGEGWTQAEMAEKLGISKMHLCDIEKGRRRVSPERAAHFARVLGYSEEQYVRLALQALVDDAGLRFHVELSAA
jgi:transcriptional regulator with XRE-family HTH domain